MLAENERARVNFGPPSSSPPPAKECRNMYAFNWLLVLRDCRICLAASEPGPARTAPRRWPCTRSSTTSCECCICAVNGRCCRSKGMQKVAPKSTTRVSVVVKLRSGGAIRYGTQCSHNLRPVESGSASDFHPQPPTFSASRPIVAGTPVDAGWVALLASGLDGS